MWPALHLQARTLGPAHADVDVERAAVALVIVVLLAVVDVGGCKSAVAEAGMTHAGADAASDRVLLAIGCSRAASGCAYKAGCPARRRCV